ncbi:esterase-like activity of phytase family protein [Candidatus Synechococcus calcipolaris G9]|uniref:Esterase-like activity of phytase family protein n=1 Tax=Candidatus Synechococcus calcipolaris G9 TaxID=1497997 RepID=A0ABT6EXW9_9SYNE|nr:esterase-like activity of phytase family protein [Candidatus Synechococcus calcipolaris]MDG2990349.1 esterase-like activity of phytase family protein [Candidatus Synechococcus calcipolaris G9]
MPTISRLGRWWRFCLLIASLAIALTSCNLPQVQAASRLFLDLRLDFVAQVTLPSDTTFAHTSVGGLSGITYDRPRNQFYAISDDRQSPRFYTLRLNLPDPNPSEPSVSGSSIPELEITDLTLLKDRSTNPIPPNQADTEGIALTPEDTLLVSSEGVAQSESPPWIREFDRQNGQELRQYPLPNYFIPQMTEDGEPMGVRDNLGFESLTLSPTGDRLFAATESALAQDLARDGQGPIYCRLLHYVRGVGDPILIAEHLYPLEPDGEWDIANGLVELLALDNGGHFLSLERTFSVSAGFGAKLFQVSLAGATDVLGRTRLGNNSQVRPVQKQLLLDLRTLGFSLDNLEGLSFGPALRDHHSSLVIIADNDFQPQRPTQLLIFDVAD